MRPAVAVMPPNEIIFTSSKFEQMRQTQKTTPMIKKGREKERFIILVFYVVFKHTVEGCRRGSQAAKLGRRFSSLDKFRRPRPGEAKSRR